MRMKMSNETKTGLFVIICLAVLGGLLIKVGNFNFFKTGYIIKSHFHFTGGVKKNSPVRLSGVDVGEVKAIRMIYGDDTQVEMDLWVDEGTQIRLDSHAYVTTLGLMGEKYIEIKSGTPAAGIAKAGDSIPGDDPVRLEELIAIGTKVAGDVGQMAKDISKVANHVDGAIQENRSKIDNIFSNLEETSENFNDFSQNLKFHPWKVLAKGKEATKEEMERERADKRAKKAGLAPVSSAPAQEPVGTAKFKTNFGPAKN
jgi:phospholipid/cholesterol/gamma-HCH transport system substrate-binding protein